jgi:hypothetical protein
LWIESSRVLSTNGLGIFKRGHTQEKYTGKYSNAFQLEGGLSLSGIGLIPAEGAGSTLRLAALDELTRVQAVRSTSRALARRHVVSTGIKDISGILRQKTN